MDFKDLRDAPNSNGAPPEVIPAPTIRRRVSPAVIALSALSGVLLIALTAVTTFLIVTNRQLEPQPQITAVATVPVHNNEPFDSSWVEDMVEAAISQAAVSQTDLGWIGDLVSSALGSATAWADWGEAQGDFWSNWADNWENSRNGGFTGNFGNFNTASWAHDTVVIDLADSNVEFFPNHDATDVNLRFFSYPRGNFFVETDDSLRITQVTGNRLVGGDEAPTLRVYLPHFWNFDHISVNTLGEIHIDDALTFALQGDRPKILRPLN
ncbi:MAG: hypothetical protein FWB98_00535 [Defluviitaleaceae bacterium]|nr:hypothetical protein [Defluviitaleaceae bacterium]